MDDSVSRCDALSITEEGHRSAGYITTSIVHWATPPLCKDGVIKGEETPVVKF